MEPKLPAPSFELTPTPVRSPETDPTVQSDRSPEVQTDRRVEQGGQGESVPADNTTPTLPMPVLPVPPVPVMDDTTTQSVTDDNPAAANDDDLIEKEWVDKAKQIIVQTRDDPYRREQEVSRLQVDYLRKRYGKELGASQ